MANHAMFFGWNRPFVGREKEAGEIFNSSVAYWTKKQEAGEIESFEPVLLALHGGDLNGFMIVRGDQQKLHTIVNSVEFRELVRRIDHCVDGFGVVPAYIGQKLADEMAAWMKMISG